MPDNKVSLTQKIVVHLGLGLLIQLLVIGSLLYLNPANVLNSLPITLSVIAISAGIVILVIFLRLKALLSPLPQITNFFDQLKTSHPSNLAISSGDELETLAQKINETFGDVSNVNNNFIKNQENLLHDKIRLSAALTYVADGIIGLNFNRQVVIFNKAIQNMMGISENEALGKDIKEVIKVANKDGEISELIYCPVDSVSENLVLFNEKGMQVSNAAQTKKATADLITTKIVDGHTIGLSCMMTLRDVSQTKELDDMKLDFVSMAAHELRTPLTSIKGYLSVFMQENKDKLNADQKMLLDNINSSSERLTSLVENLLNVSRIERGGLTINMQMVDWLDLLKNIVKDHIERAREKQIDLELVLPDYSIPQVHADKIRIGEVISNLLSNSIKYSEPHGKIKVTVESNGKEVITNVSDTGHGIPEDSLPYLFNKFYRVNSKLEYGSKGNGLGLYITKSIVELHHGKIWVKSKVGQGSTFSFSLPL